MKKIDTYIVEKLKISKNIKSTDISVSLKTLILWYFGHDDLRREFERVKALEKNFNPSKDKKIFPRYTEWFEYYDEHKNDIIDITVKFNKESKKFSSLIFYLPTIEDEYNWEIYNYDSVEELEKEIKAFER